MVSILFRWILSERVLRTRSLVTIDHDGAGELRFLVHLCSLLFVLSIGCVERCGSTVCCIQTILIIVEFECVKGKMKCDASVYSLTATTKSDVIIETNMPNVLAQKWADRNKVVRYSLFVVLLPAAKSPIYSSSLRWMLCSCISTHDLFSAKFAQETISRDEQLESIAIAPQRINVNCRFVDCLLGPPLFALHSSEEIEDNCVFFFCVVRTTINVRIFPEFLIRNNSLGSGCLRSKSIDSNRPCENSEREQKANS